MVLVSPFSALLPPFDRFHIAMADSIERFVAQLALAQTGDLFNQYANDVPGLDRPGGADLRRSNL
jgi:hypothetical protein